MATEDFDRSSVREKILNNIEIVTESGCWIWMAGQDPCGYGNPFIDGKKRGAHRLSYVEFVGDIPEGLCVCHTCDIPACINPNHLFVGTHMDNAHDKIRKGRARDRNGVAYNLNGKIKE